MASTFTLRCVRFKVHFWALRTKRAAFERVQPGWTLTNQGPGYGSDVWMASPFNHGEMKNFSARLEALSALRESHSIQPWRHSEHSLILKVRGPAPASGKLNAIADWAFSAVGPQLWNALSPHVKTAPTVECLKTYFYSLARELCFYLCFYLLCIHFTVVFCLFLFSSILLVSVQHSINWLFGKCAL